MYNYTVSMSKIKYRISTFHSRTPSCLSTHLLHDDSIITSTVAGGERDKRPDVTLPAFSRVDINWREVGLEGCHRCRPSLASINYCFVDCRVCDFTKQELLQTQASHWSLVTSDRWRSHLSTSNGCRRPQSALLLMGGVTSPRERRRWREGAQVCDSR